MTDFPFQKCLHDKAGELIRTPVMDAGVCCVFRVVLSAWCPPLAPPSLSFRAATLWAFSAFPLSGAPVPSSRALLLSIVLVCLVFCLRLRRI